MAGFPSAGVIVSLAGYTAASVVDNAASVVRAATVAALPPVAGGECPRPRPPRPPCPASG
ncbi:hypothetical protein ABZ438_29350 [Streptomyces sp. NPDC005786]|uniref:hypothetical protein n=1 Tax=Streptomyces sp. NPDC005786 TaxID=3154891 RepID=UPI0033BFDC71